jgi:hypothetical protein
MAPPPTLITIDGVERSIREWARIRDINLTTVSMRRQRGWTDRQALGFDDPPEKQPVAKIEINGELVTIRQAALASDLTPNCVRNRVNRGWHRKRLTLPKQY